MAVIGDETRVLARGAAGPADEIGATSDSTRLRDALEGALANALAAAHLPPQTTFDAIVAGVSGYEGRIYGQAPRMPAQHFLLLHDAPIAHAGAFRGGPGVVVIAGTGSVAYALAGDGRTRTSGGWGYLFGDEGSAFWIARTFIARATENATLCARCSSTFDVANLRVLVRAFYSGEISRERLASFAAIALTSEEMAEAARDANLRDLLLRPYSSVRAASLSLVDCSAMRTLRHACIARRVRYCPIVRSCNRRATRPRAH